MFETSETQLHKKNESQEKQILEALKRGERFTTLEMIYRFGSMQAPARIFYLREKGYNIRTDMVKRNGKRVAQYSLEN